MDSAGHWGRSNHMSQGQKVSLVFLAALVSATAMGPMAMQLLVPSIPAIAAHFEVSLGLASLNFSVSAVTIAISTLFYGPLSDRFGRRPVLLVGIAIFVVGTIIAGIAPSLWILIAGRVVQAVGGAAERALANSPGPTRTWQPVEEVIRATSGSRHRSTSSTGC